MIGEVIQLRLTERQLIFKDTITGDLVVAFHPEALAISDFIRENVPVEKVELTGEVLEGMGFVKNGFKQYRIDATGQSAVPKEIVIDLNAGYIWLSEKSRILGATADMVTVWNRDKAAKYYLSQLQQLYTALTGQKLPG